MSKIGHLIQTHNMLIRIYHNVQFIAIQVIVTTELCYTNKLALPLLSEAFKSQAGHCCPEAIDGEVIQVTPDHSLLLTKTHSFSILKFWCHAF